MPATNNNRQPQAFLSRLLSVLLKSIFLLALLFVLDKLLPSIGQQTQSFVVSKWQQINLLQQQLPTENSLPSPLPEQQE